MASNPDSTDRTNAGPISDPSRRLPLWRGLTLRLGLTALGLAILVSLLGGAVELALDLKRERARVADMLRQTVAMVSDSATEAAYQMNPTVAAQVMDGLAKLETVTHARLSDNFGGELAVLDRRPANDRLQGGWIASLFQDVTRHQMELVHETLVRRETVGTLSVALSPEQVGANYRDGALWVLASGAVRALGTSALLALAFALLVVRPMLRLTNDIERVDPARPTVRPISVPRGHGGDELGHVARSMNALLTAFDQSLSARERAEAELRALTGELEDRVAQRTQALEDAMRALASEKAETERAFVRLDEAHGDLEKANGLVLESIHYARRIQTSLLPDKQALDGLVADLHVCWEPLDVVGGDYFWLDRLDEDTGLLVVMDCTGHGVPGAFMTLVVASTLDRVLHDQGARQPSDILRRLDAQVRERLRQDRPDSDSDDGLEAAACLWDRRTRTLTFCGAGLPLFIADQGHVTIIRGDRAQLGYRTLPGPDTLTDHTVTVRTGQCFYLVTDGIPDHMNRETRRLLGRRRLGALIEQAQQPPQGASMARQLAWLREELGDYRGDQPRVDDMTMIGFRLL